jgi:tetratricopeptide (TPR) repeat protein
MQDVCCDNPAIEGQITIEGDQFREIRSCGSCGKVLANEVIPAPIVWAPDNCIHCGGLLEEETWREGTAKSDSRCCACELSPSECIDMHRRLATAESGQASLIAAAVRALESERAVLAVKLSTAAAAAGEDPTYARFIRLKALSSGKLVDHALDEAWAWVEAGEHLIPSEVYDWLTTMEAETGNIPGIRRAIEVHLRVSPDNLATWTDYGELLLALEESQKAIQAAAYALTSPDAALSERNLAVILEIAEDMYRRELYAESLAAVAYAGDYLETHVELAWLRARIAAIKNDVETSREWLQTVLALEPNHSEAKAAWEKVKPAKKRGWFF